jgi:hypothetical protein
MNTLKSLSITLLAFAANLTPDTARASSGGFGDTILQCFHPGAEFVSISYKKGHDAAHGKSAWKGWLAYQDKSGGRTTDAVMSFSLDTRTEDGMIEVRVTPIDDASSSTSCRLRDWQSSY